MKKKKVDFYKKITNWANNKGFRNIKANTEGFETPRSFTKKDSEEEEIIPDITATSFGSKYYFEIVTKPTQNKIKQNLISKWKLLSLLAERKGGKLYLFAPHGNKSFTQNIMSKYKIKAKFISLPKLKMPKAAVPRRTVAISHSLYRFYLS